MSFNWRSAAQLRINIGDGQTPTARSFNRVRFPIWYFSGGIHSNPRFYKYHWKIWTWLDIIPDEDIPEFKRRFGPRPWNVIVPTLSFSEAIRRMTELCGRGERFLVSSNGVKRADPTAPWDIPRLHADGADVAPAYDDDDDEPFHGHK